MKVLDIQEMTFRTGAPMEQMPFPEFLQQDLTLEGKMQDGHEVYSFSWNDTTIYGCKVDDDFASFTQVRPRTIPKIGIVQESLNSKTKTQYRGQMLSFKLKFFIMRHLGKSILLGNVHSIATEKALPKIASIFNLSLVDVNTGEEIEWSDANYQKLTNRSSATNWQVLMKGSKLPFKEDTTFPMSWAEPNRHLWTWCDFFEGLILDDF